MNLALSADDHLGQPSSSPYSKKRSNQEEIELQKFERKNQEPQFPITLEDEQQEQHMRRKMQIMIEANSVKVDDEISSRRLDEDQVKHQRLSIVSDSSTENNSDLPFMKEYSVRNQTILRVVFSCCFLLLLFYSMFNVERVDVITRDECMRDYSFKVTETINKYLIDNLDIKNRYIIFCSFMMDLMIIILMALFYLYWKTYRLMFAYILFFVCRAILQKNFFMTRLEGFTFFDPGMYSITVPYHDVNDFFYSGHVGTCMLVYLEFRSAKYYNLSRLIMFILINEWLMLCFVRTHYIIDLVTGVIFAHYMFQASEKISFIFDQVLIRIPAKKRFREYYKPCKCCGWGNMYAGDFIDSKEQKILKVLNSDSRKSDFLIHKGKSLSSNEIEQNNFEIGKEKSIKNNKLGDYYVGPNMNNQYQNHGNNNKIDKVGKYAKQLDDI
ncbi:UNKNOWN [Stylonychia lemnae]|uniref:AtPDCT1/2 transmembrane domain-containing protein n=1 Tax=Stylonychia lemnae TaxID=5949 RepID=A0A078B274_STYLE|nr:UNKNOWN [Stylonychia lemnae]|eukprot:CDW87357.1 UNKNOWN [Stylonychia lemnae]